MKTFVSVFLPAEGEEEESCCGHRLKSSDLQLREILYIVSAEGDVKHSNEEKGEAEANL